MTEIAAKCQDIAFLVVDDYLCFRLCSNRHITPRPGTFYLPVSNQDDAFFRAWTAQIREWSIFFFLIDFLKNSKYYCRIHFSIVFPLSDCRMLFLILEGFIEVDSESHDKLACCSSRCLRIPSGVDTGCSVVAGLEWPSARPEEGGPPTGVYRCLTVPKWEFSFFSPCAFSSIDDRLVYIWHFHSFVGIFPSHSAIFPAFSRARSWAQPIFPEILGQHLCSTTEQKMVCELQM